MLGPGVPEGALGGMGRSPSTCPMLGTSHLLKPRGLIPCYLWEIRAKIMHKVIIILFSILGLTQPPGHIHTPTPCTPKQVAVWKEGADVSSPFSTWLEMLIKHRVIKHLEGWERGRASRHDPPQLPPAFPWESWAGGTGVTSDFDGTKAFS